MKITELIKKHSELSIEIENVKELLDTAYIDYHKKLIDAGFYSEYEVDGEPLDKFFWIRPYSFPEKDQGEGDFIRIDLVVDGNSLNVNYECSWRRTDDYCIASIPLELLDGDLQTLKSQLVLMNKDAKEKYKNQRIKNEQKQKAQQIANLKLQLKNLGEKV